MTVPRVTVTVSPDAIGEIRRMRQELDDLRTENTRLRHAKDPADILRHVPFVEVRHEPSYPCGMALYIDGANVSTVVKSEGVKFVPADPTEGEHPYLECRIVVDELFGVPFDTAMATDRIEPTDAATTTRPGHDPNRSSCQAEAKTDIAGYARGGLVTNPSGDTLPFMRHPGEKLITADQARAAMHARAAAQQ